MCGKYTSRASPLRAGNTVQTDEFALREKWLIRELMDDN